MDEPPAADAPGLGRPAQQEAGHRPLLETSPAPALETAHEALAPGVRPRVDMTEVRMKWQVRHRVVIDQVVEAKTEREALAVAARTEKAEMPLLLRFMERGGRLQLLDNGWVAMPLAMRDEVRIQKAPRSRPQASADAQARPSTPGIGDCTLTVKT